MKLTYDSNGSPLRFAMIGCGFWARYQLAAWQELEGVECVAICDSTLSKAESLSAEFDISSVYKDADEMMTNENLDFVDIVTNVDTHSQLVRLAAEHRLPAICQKPLALTLAEAKGMISVCRQAGVPLLVHENWRWQRPIRQVKAELDRGKIGTPFRVRMEMISGFPVFDNQPSLREIEQLILADLGTHILDTARYLFGEAQSIFCQTHSIHRNIRGEDVATIVMSMNNGKTTVTCNLAYAGNTLEREYFPQTMIFIEADKGSLELKPDYWIHETTVNGTLKKHCAPKMYDWVDPDYAVAQSSMVDCHADLLRGLRNREYQAETSSEDNIKTLKLVFDAYESAKKRIIIRQDEPMPLVRSPHTKSANQRSVRKGIKV